MTLAAFFPVLVAILALVTYALSNNPKVMQLALAAFLAGMIATCFMFAQSGVLLRLR